MSSIIIKNIDETCPIELLNEIIILKAQRNKYNPFDIPSPNINRKDFVDGKAYTKAKELYRVTYKKEYNILNDEIARLSDINTNICIEQKKKIDAKAMEDGTYYNHNEIAHIEEKHGIRKLKRKKAQQDYYNKNKEKLINDSLAYKIAAAQNRIKLLTTQHTQHLLKTNEIISPVCPCGRRCDVINFKSLVKHSSIVKHQIFKSIIGLVYYQRQNKRIKKVITKINNDLHMFKKNIRIKNDKGDSVVVLNKTDKEIYKLYNDMVGEIDESKFILRNPSINRVKITKKYKRMISILGARIINIKKVNN